MFTQHILNKLELLSVAWKRTGTNYLLCQCLNPSHNDSTPSMSVNTDTGYSKCFTCGFTLHKEYWVDGVLDEEALEQINRASKYKLLKDSLKKQEIGLQESGLPVNDGEVTEGYRGLSKETLSTFGMFTCNTGKYADRVVFPFYEDKLVVGFTTRANFECNTKYLHSKGFNNGETLYPLDVLKATKSNTVVLVEGIIDCITLWQMGIPSVCNFGVANHFTSTKIAKLLSCGVEEVVLCMDKDTPGQVAELELFKVLKSIEDLKVTLGRSYVPLSAFYKSEFKDINEYYMGNVWERK